MLLVSMFNTVENYVKTSQMAASCAVKFYSNPGVAVMNARLDFKFFKGKFTLKPYLGQFKNETVSAFLCGYMRSVGSVRLEILKALHG